MDDELNIDPRETDYLDDYDMSKEINFHELKTQLADLGFTDPLLVDGLRAMAAGDQSLHDLYTKEDGADFWLSYQKQDADGYQMYCIDAAMDIPGKINNQVMQYLQPDVPVSAATELLRLSLNVHNGHGPF